MVRKSHQKNLTTALEPATYYELIKKSINSKNLILGKLVHSHMIRSYYRPGLFVHNNLLSMYCEFGEVRSAHQLFDRMPRRDITSWNSLMTGYSQAGMWDRAIDVFREARNEDLVMDRFSYAGMLAACGAAGDLRKGMIVHGLVVVTGLSRRVFLTNSLIDMYSKCGRIDDVRFVFDHAEELDEVSWNLLLSGYVRVGWPEVATNILVWMQRYEVKLNCYALGSVLKACSSLKDSKDVQRMLHASVIKVGLDLDYFVGSAMLDIYAKNGGLCEAIKIFKSIPNPNVVVFNAMIAGFCRLGTDGGNEARICALRLFSEMLRRCLRPSKFSFKSVLEACNFTKEFNYGKQIHAQVVKADMEEDEFIASALVELYSNSGSIEGALRCYSCTPRKKTFPWTSMINGYFKNHHFERAVQFFKEFLGLDRKPDQYMLSNLMNAFSDLGLMKSGEQIQAFAIKSGFDRFTIYSNSQICMYAKSGDTDAAFTTFQETGTLDVISWSAMIMAYALSSCPRNALILFEKMKECGVASSDTSFLTVLTACSNGRMVEEGLRYFESMELEHGLIPNAKHFACIVDLLGWAGRLAEAEDFILRSRFDREPIVWRALVGACQFHRDSERGLRAAELLLKLEPCAAASYMVLYNMYLDIGKMSLAMRTRGLMRERGVNKEVAVCWIEIGKEFHSFVAGDNYDLQSDAINRKIEEIHAKLKQKERKESLSKGHGEILAVALGMIYLPKSVPIRVMKNLRVSEDCHELLKMFSETERRDIVLRDSNCFHHFTWGSCSCGDYW